MEMKGVPNQQQQRSFVLHLMRDFVDLVPNASLTIGVGFAGNSDMGITIAGKQLDWDKHKQRMVMQLVRQDRTLHKMNKSDVFDYFTLHNFNLLHTVQTCYFQIQN